MILRMKTKHTYDDEAISKLIDTEFSLPTTFEGMIENIKVVHDIIICFAPNCWVAKCYAILIDNLTRIQQDSKKLIAMDNRFIAKILSNIDNRTYRLIEECSLNLSDLSKVNFNIVDMRDISTDIIQGKYTFQNLPNCIKSFPSQNSITPGGGNIKKSKEDTTKYAFLLSEPHGRYLREACPPRRVLLPHQSNDGIELTPNPSNTSPSYPSTIPHTKLHSKTKVKTTLPLSLVQFHLNNHSTRTVSHDTRHSKYYPCLSRSYSTNAKRCSISI